MGRVARMHGMVMFAEEWPHHERIAARSHTPIADAARRVGSERGTGWTDVP
jgi:hypothetical protein